MKLTILALFAVLVGSSLVTKKVVEDQSLYAPSAVIKNDVVMDLELPDVDNLAASSSGLKLSPAKKTIVLEKKNMLVFRGPVTAKSVAETQAKLLKMSYDLKRSDVIYLVLDTPGGSVFAGMQLIDHLRAVPQRIQTVTLFAASMGFQIVQNMDKRYITRSGTLMSHRARGGIQGQFDGELETRYKMVKRAINYLDAIASKRMDLSLDAYRKLIKDEYWVHGFDASADKAADEMVNLNCGKTLNGTEKKEFMTFFGPVDVTFSKCPLIRGPLKVDFKRLTGTAKQNIDTRNAINTLLNHKRKYVEEYILTDKHFNYFK